MKIFRYLLPIFLATHAYGMEQRLTRTEVPEDVNAQVKVAFVPQDDVKKELFDFLDQAKEYVYVAMYWLIDFDVINKLISLKNNGKDVKVIVDESSFFEPKTNIEKPDLKHKIQFDLEAIAFPSKNTQPHYIMHNKFVVRDDEAVWTGSANFTPAGLSRNHENTVIIKSREIAKKYREIFVEIGTRIAGFDPSQLESSERDIFIEPPVKRRKEQGGSLHERSPHFEMNVLAAYNYFPEILTYDEVYYLVGQIQRGNQKFIPTPWQVSILKDRNVSIKNLDKKRASQIINQISEEEGWPPSRR